MFGSVVLTSHFTDGFKARKVRMSLYYRVPRCRLKVQYIMQDFPVRCASERNYHETIRKQCLIDLYI